MLPFTFKIGGEAGFGIMSAGNVLSKIAARSGYNTFAYAEYPSLIRGGHNVVQVAISDKKLNSQYLHSDFLVALNQETVDRHSEFLSKDAYILFDPENKLDFSKIPNSVQKIEIPLLKILRDMNGAMIMRNTVAIGASLAVLDGNLEHLLNMIEEQYSHKDQKIVKLNHFAAKKGYDYAKKHYKEKIRKVLSQKSDVRNKIILTGNEAIGLGSVAAGMNFAAIYPMTPTSNILHTLAPNQEEYGFIYKQPEDELAAINMAIGAGYAGARSIVATSGGGFALMAEGYGLAALTETPVVIIEGMRGAPATGLPTWTEQGDLRFVLHAHQGDFPRIVLAPGDVEECFHMTMTAFNLADKYQTPVIVLVDKHVLESPVSVLPFEYGSYEIDRGKYSEDFIENYKRYKPAKDGISLRSIPGTGNHFVANSDEHDEYGYSNEEIENRNTQMKKRMQKLETCKAEDMEDAALHGPKDASTTIVSWGSNKGAIIAALDGLEDTNFLQIKWMNPFPTESVKKVIESAKKVINIECNYSAQLGGLITQHTGMILENNILKYDGRPFYPSEVVEKVKKI